jgi:hypothetical protein
MQRSGGSTCMKPAVFALFLVLLLLVLLDTSSRSSCRGTGTWFSGRIGAASEYRLFTVLLHGFHPEMMCRETSWKEIDEDNFLSPKVPLADLSRQLRSSSAGRADFRIMIYYSSIHGSISKCCWGHQTMILEQFTFGACRLCKVPEALVKE